VNAPPAPPAARRRLTLLGGLLVAALGAAYATYGTTLPGAEPGDATPAGRPQSADSSADSSAAGPAGADAADLAVAGPAAAGREPAAPDTVVLEREVYGYAGGGRRDPFRPLIVTTVLRPFPSELRLTAVAYDPAGVSSVAILRDVTTKAQHRVRPGQLVGRMRVVRIHPKSVVFAVEELGFSRRETLTLQDSSGTRQP
jgi:hypothetical protein